MVIISGKVKMSVKMSVIVNIYGRVKMLVVNEYVNVKFNADTNGKMKKFMHDLLM